MFPELGRIADALEDLVRLQAASLRGQAAVGGLKSLPPEEALLGPPEEFISYVSEAEFLKEEEEALRKRRIR